MSKPLEDEFKERLTKEEFKVEVDLLAKAYKHNPKRVRERYLESKGIVRVEDGVIVAVKEDKKELYVIYDRVYKSWAVRNIPKKVWKKDN